MIIAMLLLSQRAILHYVHMDPTLCLYCALKMPPNPRIAIDRFGGAISFILWIVIFTNRIVGLFRGNGEDNARTWVYRLIAWWRGLPSKQPQARTAVIDKVETLDSQPRTSQYTRSRALWYAFKLCHLDLKASTFWDLLWLHTIAAISVTFIIYRWISAPKWNENDGGVFSKIMKESRTMGFGQLVAIILLLLLLINAF